MEKERGIGNSTHLSSSVRARNWVELRGGAGGIIDRSTDAGDAVSGLHNHGVAHANTSHCFRSMSTLLYDYLIPLYSVFTFFNTT